MIHLYGEILSDVYTEGGRQVFYPGGAAYNVACAVASLGGKAGFSGALGDDEIGRFLLEDSRKRGLSYVDIDVHDGLSSTAAYVTNVDGERTFSFVRQGVDGLIPLGRMVERVKEKDIVHFGSLLLSLDEGYARLNEGLHLAKGLGTRLSFDVNYRASLFRNEEEARERYLDILPHFDYVKMSEEEVLWLAGSSSLYRSSERLCREGQLLIVSLGHKGSLYVYQGEIKAVPVTPLQPLDATGAGDNFWAYVLFALDGLKEPLSGSILSDVLAHANICGALSTLRRGGVGVTPSLEEISAKADGLL